MASSAGKTIGLLLLVMLIILLAWRLTPLILAPLGIFSGTVHIFRFPELSLKPWGFHLIPATFISLVLLVFWIAVIVWVYRDAERRGMNGILWALLVLIGNLIGLIIYLILRSDSVPVTKVSAESTKTCPKCQKQAMANLPFCPHCGNRLQYVCPSCGKPLDETWVSCPHCGNELKKKE